MTRASRYWTFKDWLRVFQKARAEGGRLLPLASLSRASGLAEPSVRKALARLERNGLVSRVGVGLYSTSLAPAGLEEIAMAARRPCYVSFESALSAAGVLSQSPMVLTCATTRKPGRLKVAAGEAVFRHLAAGLFWGFWEDKGVLRARPEKALLDWLYWNSKTEGRIPELDELSLEHLDMRRLTSWSGKFPRTIRKIVGRLTSEG